jgi:ERCC4-type nuclease
MVDKQLPVIIIDTREKAPYEFNLETQRKKLNAGDYSIKGLETKITVERKSYEHTCIIVEATLKTIKGGHYISKAHPNSVMGKMFSIIIEYNVPVYCCSNRETATYFVEKYLIKYSEKYNKNLCL